MTTIPRRIVIDLELTDEEDGGLLDGILADLGPVIAQNNDGGDDIIDSWDARIEDPREPVRIVVAGSVVDGLRFYGPVPGQLDGGEVNEDFGEERGRCPGQGHRRSPTRRQAADLGVGADHGLPGHRPAPRPRAGRRACPGRRGVARYGVAPDGRPPGSSSCSPSPPCQRCDRNLGSCRRWPGGSARPASSTPDSPSLKHRSERPDPSLNLNLHL